MKHEVKEVNSGFWCNHCGAYLGIRRDEISGECVELDEVIKAQKEYEEEATKLHDKVFEDRTPDICGYYGRGCRRMYKGQSGGLSMLCSSCPICEKLPY